jgi:FkbM family methyltransferase
MKFHAFHFTPVGVVRAWSHLQAGRRLCRTARVSLRSYVPASINSMTTAWNYSRTLQEAGLDPPGTILDVGANASQMTKLLTLTCPQTPRVVSFEPNPAVKPIGDVRRIALLDRAGVVPFQVERDSAWGRVAAAGQPSSFEVRAERFDVLVRSGEVPLADLPRPIVVKIDTEGTEVEVVEGFGECLAHVDQMLIEVTNRQDGVVNNHLFRLCDRLAKHGFRQAKILYACYDGPLAPTYADVLFWK